jgi:beta-lactamase regulating signal transducer with metallopeptidase domain/biopolymer transport protein ExbD
VVEAINAWAGSWARYFGFAVVQNTVFLSVILVVLYLRRGLPANVKYLICLVGLVKLLIPPFVPAALDLTGSALQSSLVWVTYDPVTAPLLPVGGVVPPHEVPLSTAGIAFLAWAGLGASYMLLSLLSTIRLRRALRAGLRVVDRDTGIPAGTKVIMASRLAVPLTLGLFPREIYVPAAWRDWSDDCRKSVIAHEMAHIRRRDGLIQVLQVLTRAAYLFHPLVWLIDRRINRYREMACDDEASRTCAGGSQLYSKYLLEIAENTFACPVVCGSASALLRERNHLLNRVKYQVQEGNMQVISQSKKALIVGGLVLLTLPMSWYCGSAEHRAESSVVQETPSSKLPEGMQVVEVTVKSKDLVAVDGREVAVSRLEERLRERVGDRWDDSVILLGCDDGVTMDVVNAVREQLVDAKLRKVIFSQDGGAELPLILPDKGDQERLQQLPKEDVAVLRVDPFGKAFLDDEPVKLSEVTEAVRAKLAGNDKLVVSIQTLGVSPYGDFATLLALVKAAGATRISIGIPTEIGQ